MPAVSSNWFVEWFNSPYYHKLYVDRDGQEAAAFIDRLISRLQPPAGSLMAETGCGYGQHALQLAKKGFDVTGIDISAENIAVAEANNSGNLHFFVHDIRLPFWVNYFDYVFSFFTGFGFYRTEREHYNAIRTLAGSLQQNGLLVLDYLNVHYAQDNLEHKQEKHVDGVTFYITKWFDEDHFYKKIEIVDKALQAPLSYTEKIAKFTLGDFNDMFAFHGLQLQDVYGDYQFGSYDIRKSPRLLMIAKKQSTVVSR
jgi:SAM-dependent methyltransferase